MLKPRFNRPGLYPTKKLLPLALSIILSACGGGSGGDNSGTNLTLSGNINTADYPLASAPGLWQKLAGLIGFKPAYAQEIHSVDTLVAIPSDGGNIDIGVFGNIKSASIASDGSFNLTLTKEYDWVLLLVNSKALTSDQKVVAYVTVPASVAVAEDGSLVDLPFSAATGSAINLGELSASTTDPQAARSAQDAPSIEASLSLSLDDLKKYAKSDDAYRHFANVYLNYQAATDEYYFPSVEWRWSGIPAAELGSNYTDPANFGIPSVYTEIETNTAGMNFTGLCNGPISLGLFPPKSIAINGQEFGINKGIMNNTMSLGNSGYDYCFNDNGVGIQSDGSSLFFGFPLARAEGLWRLKADDQQVALFDFSLADPLDADGNPLNFVPSIRLNRDAQNPERVESIDIQWWQYDSESKRYIEVKDDEVTDKLVAQSFVETVDYSEAVSGQDVSFGQYDEAGLISGKVTIDGGYQWYFGATSSDPGNGIAHITDISVSYTQGGVSYRFTWGEASAG